MSLFKNVVVTTAVQCALNSQVITVIKTTLINGRDVKFDLMPVKCAFYSSRNSNFVHSKSLN